MFASVDLYCERHDAHLWAEPLNAVTNLAFVAAGLWGVSRARRYDAGPFAMILCWWVVAIGVGSGLFHTFANRLTMWADILPIAGFTLAYTVFTLRRFIGFSWSGAAGVTLAFYVLAGAVTWLLPSALHAASNGSTGYLPAFLALVVFGSWALARGNAAGWYNLGAAALFAASLTFRSLDAALCDVFPVGTHFMWHVLNGLMLAVILAAVTGAGRAFSADRPRSS